MIGSVVEKVLGADGCEVIGFDIANGHNILNPNEIGSALKGCDAVVHLAALLGHSEDAPDEIMAVNLLGTWHINRFLLSLFHLKNGLVASFF